VSRTGALTRTHVGTGTARAQDGVEDVAEDDVGAEQEELDTGDDAAAFAPVGDKDSELTPQMLQELTAIRNGIRVRTIFPHALFGSTCARARRLGHCADHAHRPRVGQVHRHFDQRGQ
jgi:hypothetical protein